MGAYKFDIGDEVVAAREIELWDAVTKGMRGVVLSIDQYPDHVYYVVDFSKSFPGGVPHDEDAAFCRENELEAATAEAPVYARAQAGWSTPPTHCPYCGGTELVTMDNWNSYKQDEPGNEAELTECQCTGKCGGRSFWVST